jgi:Leucine-rich repeat (LRR) protein
MKSLTNLDISHNAIKRIPEEFSNLVYLVELNISNNQISHLPDSFGWLINLNQCYYKVGLIFLIFFSCVSQIYNY